MKCRAITNNGEPCLNKAKDGLYCRIHINSKNVKLPRNKKMGYCYKRFLEAKDEVRLATNKMEFYMKKLYEYA
ncbi:unnamed protein product [marine sediment metagenome]|uniref:Uncharacterized protein n=1 Tax=marine sediment metagenome TaxID=412755 RepID=X0VXT8_9ZZZZ